MKKTISAIAATLLLLATVACEKRTEREITIGETSTSETSTTTITADVPAIDTTATAAAKENVKEAGRATAEAGRDAAHATGTALEAAGKKIQKHAKPGNQP